MPTLHSRYGRETRGVWEEINSRKSMHDKVREEVNVSWLEKKKNRASGWTFWSKQNRVTRDAIYERALWFRFLKFRVWCVTALTVIRIVLTHVDMIAPIYVLWHSVVYLFMLFDKAWWMFCMITPLLTVQCDTSQCATARFVLCSGKRPDASALTFHTYHATHTIIPDLPAEFRAMFVALKERVQRALFCFNGEDLLFPARVSIMLMRGSSS